MNALKEINFAVVGCGHIGKRHAEMIRQNEGAKLVAMCDIRSVGELGLEDNDVNLYPTIPEMFAAHPEIDVINICTPNGKHADMALESLEYGKHVVVEKPLGLSADKCQRIFKLSKEMDKQVFCVMQNRYSPPSVWMKNVVDQGLLGEIYMVQLNCYWNRDDQYYFPQGKRGWKGRQDLDGGTLFTQFSHFIDIMYWLFGDITNIQGSFADFRHSHSTDFEDSGIVTFDFVNAGMGSINYSTALWNENFESSVTVIAEKGTVKLGGQYMDKVTYCKIENYEMPELEAPLPPNDYGTYKGSAANHHFVIQNIVETLNGKSDVTTNAEQGLAVVGIIERIYATRPENVLKKLTENA